MKRIIILFVFFILSTLNSYADYTIWEVKDVDFWTEIGENNEKFDKQKNEQLEAQIELDMGSQKKEIDLIEAINLGIQNSTSYKIAKYKKEYSNWEFANKLSEFLPNVSYSFNLSDLKGEFLVGGILPRYIHETVFSNTIIAQWDIVKGKTYFEAVQMNMQKKEQKYKENYSKDELIHKIVSAYYSLLQKNIELEVYRYNLVELKEQLAYNEMIYKIGTGTKFDILRSKSEVESAQSDIENAIFNLKVAQTNLANLIGMPILSNLLPKDKFINKIELVDESKSIEELFDSALIMRNDIIAKENSIKSLFAKRNANFSDIIPTVSVSWQGAIVGTFATGGRRNDTLGLSVTAPIGKNLGVNTWTKYKMDNINCKVAQLELDRLKTDIQQNIANNYYSIRAKNEIINSKNQQIASTNEGLRQAVGRMKIGEATYLDVLEANRLKTQSRIDFVNAIAEYNKAQIDQMFETGLINLFDIKEAYENAQKRVQK